VPLPSVMPLTYVMGRCARWGTYVRWLHRSGVASVEPRRVASWWGPIVLDGNIEQIMMVREPSPVNIPEATETGNCIMALPSHLRDTVVEEYAVRGKQYEKAESLRIDVDTLRHRLNVAYPLLLELFNLAAASLPLECSYRGPGRPPKASNDDPTERLAEATSERHEKAKDSAGTGNESASQGTQDRCRGAEQEPTGS
jgi:hypothetical protein